MNLWVTFDSRISSFFNNQFQMCCSCDWLLTVNGLLRFFRSPTFLQPFVILQPLSGSTAGLLLISLTAAVEQFRLFYSRFTASGCRIAMKLTLKPNHFWNWPFIFSFKDPWNMTWDGNAQAIFENFQIFLVLRFYTKVDHWYQKIRKTASLGSHNGAKCNWAFW